MKKILIPFIMLLNVVAFSQEQIHSYIVCSKNESKKQSISYNASIQDISRDIQNKKGYIGFSGGFTFPMDDFSSHGYYVGGNGNIDFGYLFSKYIGIAAKSYFSSYISNEYSLYYDDVFYDELYYYNDPLLFYGTMFGPFASLPFSEKFNLDFRLMIGPCLIFNLTDVGINFNTSFSGSFGTLFRFNLSRWVALTTSVDFFWANPKFKFDYYYPYNYTQKKSYTIFNASLSVGAAFRF